MKIRIAFFASVITMSIAAALNVGAQDARPPAAAADEEEAVRISTRVVFLDALVREKKTGAAIFDLESENFEVLADGKRRTVSYFAREGDQSRRPLALTLIFDLQRHGAGRFMRRTEIVEAMSAALSKLPPTDEVAVIALNAGGADGKREWLSRFTVNRAQVSTALSIIPALVAAGAEGDGSDEGEQIALTPDAAAQTNKVPESEGSSGQTGEDDEDGDAVEVEQITDREGNKVTRTVKSDGTIEWRRTNADGSVTTDATNVSDLPGVVREIAEFAARERPNSQAAVVYLTDGLVPIFYAERDYVESKMLRSNIIFNALVTDMKTSFKLFMPIIKPLGNWVGLSIAGSAQHLAKRTGGESLKVRRPADYAAGLGKIIGSLNARYSLGFALAEDETDDGQLLHTLEVKVRARDAKGKERKLEVQTRGGYYLPLRKNEG